jgi:hypothetical protein
LKDEVYKIFQPLIILVSLDNVYFLIYFYFFIKNTTNNDIPVLKSYINTILYCCCSSVAIFARGHLEPMEQKSGGGIAAMGV